MDCRCSRNRDGDLVMLASKNHPIDCGMATTSEFPISWEKQTIANRSFDILKIPVPRITEAGSSSPVQVGDTNYTRNVGATSVTDYSVVPLFRDGKSGFVKSITSNNTAVANNASSSDSLLSYISSGLAPIEIGLFTGEKNITVLNMEELTSNTVDVFSGFANGSAIKNSNDAFTNLKDGSTSAPTHYGYYSTYNNATSSYQKNPNCWLADYDLSGLSVKTGSGSTRMCTAITPWHALAINHFSFHPQVGEVVEFVAPDNSVVSRTVDSFSQVGSLDCVIVKFTEALPSEIKKYKMLPADAGDYFPVNRNIFNVDDVIDTQRLADLPIIVCSHYIREASYPLSRNNRFVYLHRVETAVFEESDINPIYGLGYLDFFFVHKQSSLDSGYSGYSTNIVGGDSGGSIFTIINDDLVLFSNHVGSFYSLHLCKFLSQIQSTIDSLGPSGQTIQTVDLSGFTDFSS